MYLKHEKNIWTIHLKKKELLSFVALRVVLNKQMENLSLKNLFRVFPFYQRSSADLFPKASRIRSCFSPENFQIF